MKIVFFYSVFLSFAWVMPQQTSYKQQQLSNKRVKSAYAKKETLLKNELKNLSLTLNNLHILLLAYKYEKQLQIYVKSKTDKVYKKFKTYDFCMLSGDLGPKRKEGDLQVPEGFYHVNWFNPNSNYHLSLQINYPNASDKILSDKKKPGSEIFIHGNCVSIGCIPITDEKMDELYILALEADKNGQKKIPVYIFPCELNEFKYSRLTMQYADKNDLLTFWNNLKQGHDRFIQSHKELKFRVNNKGEYVFVD